MISFDSSKKLPLQQKLYKKISPYLSVQDHLITNYNPPWGTCSVCIPLLHMPEPATKVSSPGQPLSSYLQRSILDRVAAPDFSLFEKESLKMHARKK